MRPAIRLALFVCTAIAALPARAEIIVGTGPGTIANVRVYDNLGVTVSRNFFPYGAGYSGGVRVAAGDVNGDGVADIITGADTIAPHVKVFDGLTGSELRSFSAFPGLTTGVRVASGDVNGDGRADIIVTPGAGASNAHVKVFSGTDNSEILSILTFPGITSPVTIAAGDVNGDGKADVIAGAESNGHIKAFSGLDTSVLSSFFSFNGFTGPLAVAAGDLDHDGKADLIGAVGANGHLKSFDGETLSAFASFFTFPAFAGTLDAAATDLNGDGVADYIVGASLNGHVKAFSGADQSLLASFLAFPGFSGAAFVAAVPAPGPATLFAIPFAAALLRRRRR